MNDDTIYRQEAIDACHNYEDGKDAYAYGDVVEKRLKTLLSAQPEIIRCKDCRWWDRRADGSPMGYCHACKHGHYSRHWEISIIRTYEENFFCADAERRTDE